MKRPSTKTTPNRPTGGTSASIPDPSPGFNNLDIQRFRSQLFEGIPPKEIVTLTNASGGEKYEGQVKPDGTKSNTNVRHGKGTLRWPNGNYYFGEWVEGSMGGQGIFLYGVEHDRYEGSFLDDKKHGQGLYTFANGNYYKGNFLMDKRHGKGKYCWMCGDSYDGDWEDGKMHGYGMTVYANGNKYSGDFVEDRREGKGVLQCVDGLSYSGEWKSNQRHGLGKLSFPSGDYYEGYWEGDKKHGKGKDVFMNGNMFEGMYQNNVKCGHGIMQYSNGDRYEGEWREDKMEGKGVYKFSNGFVYDGEWKSDMRHGYGVYTFPNGHVYTGGWQSDRRHGAGELQLSSGDTYIGTWKEGKMAGHFQVFVVAPGGKDDDQKERKMIYEGVWEAGVPSGEGTFYFFPRTPSDVDASVSQKPLLSFTGAWDTSKASKKSDGTVSLPSTDGALFALDWASYVTGDAIDGCFVRENPNLTATFSEEYVQLLKDNLESANEALNGDIATLQQTAQDFSQLRRRAEVAFKDLEVAPLQNIHSNASSSPQTTSASSLQKIYDEACESLEKATYSQTVLSAEYEALDKQLVEAKEEVKSTSQRLQALRKAIEHQKLADQNREKHEAKVTQGRQKVLELEALLRQLKEDDIPEAKRTAEEQKLVCQKISADHKALSKESDALKKEITDADAKLGELQKKMGSQGKQFREKIKSVQESKAQKEGTAKELEAKIVQLEKTNQSLQEESNALQKSKSDEVAQAMRELEELRVRCAACEGEILQLQERSMHKDQDLTARKDALTDLKDQLNIQTKEVDKVKIGNELQQEELEQLQSEAKKAEEELKKMDENSVLSQKKREIFDRLKQNQKKRDGELVEIESRLQACTAERDSMQEEIHALEAQLRGMGIDPLEDNESQPMKGKKSSKKIKSTRKKGGRRPSSMDTSMESGSSTLESTPLGMPLEKSSAATPSSEHSASSHTAMLPSSEGNNTTMEPPPFNGAKRRTSAVEKLRKATASREDDPSVTTTATCTTGSHHGETETQDTTIEALKAEEENMLNLLAASKEYREQCQEKYKALTADKNVLDEEVKKLQRQEKNKGKEKGRSGSSLGITEDGDPYADNLAMNAEREALHHQLIKARSVQEKLRRQRETLESQLDSTLESVKAIKGDRDLDRDAQRQTIASIVKSLGHDEWRLKYLAEQIESKQNTITELQMEVAGIRDLEDKLQLLNDTISGLTKEADAQCTRRVSSCGNMSGGAYHHHQGTPPQFLRKAGSFALSPTRPQ